MRGQRRTGLIVIVVLLLVLAVDVAHAEGVSCPNVQVTVFASASAEVDGACRVVEAAGIFLAANGMDMLDALDIHLVDHLPNVCADHSFGCYDSHSHRIDMLSMERCLALKLTPALPMDPALCRSLIAHEAAHAVVDANFFDPRPNLLVHEYVAYVTMLATLPDADVQRVMDASPGRGFDNPSQISIDYYFLNPTHFGVEAYRHFLKPGNGRAFMDDIRAGRALRR